LTTLSTQKLPVIYQQATKAYFLATNSFVLESKGEISANYVAVISEASLEIFGSIITQQGTCVMNDYGVFSFVQDYS
jgi:hypothetical protein